MIIFDSFDDFDKTFVMEHFIEKALKSYDSEYFNKENYINCRCVVCGDSKYSKRKKRGYFLKGSTKHNHWTYNCHNGDCEANSAMSVERWLRGWFPEIYEEYKTALKKDTKKYSKSTLTLSEKKIDEKEDTKHFKPILSESGGMFEKAVSYCVERKISENIWKNFFVATGGIFQGRMIIPFYDKDEKIYYYQGRTLIGREPKYMNRRIGEKEVYGKDFIDSSKPVLIVEGPIDSMFLENGLAVLGLKFSESIKKTLTGLNKYYILDRDEDGKKSSIKLLKKGQYVFNWEKFLEKKDSKVKDINDLVLETGKEKWKYEDFAEFFTKNVLDEGWFL